MSKPNIDERYPVEVLDPDYDDGTITENADRLAAAVIGHKIVSVEQVEHVPGAYYDRGGMTTLTLDNGTKVTLRDTDDCCAYTNVEDVILHLDEIDHAILGVGTTDGYETWHIYADLGDVVELKVGWSCGNPFYYGYGFDIAVEPVEETK
jgi:hypothetical protein